MQTPEEVGVGYLDVVEEMQVRPQSQEVLDRFLALIRARDAEVRAKALRDAADDMDDTDDPDAIHVNNGDIDKWLRARADRIEREGGAS